MLLLFITFLHTNSTSNSNLLLYVAMADVVVSAVLQQLTTIIYEQAKEEVKLVVGVDKEVENLATNLRAIQAVLQDAETRQVSEASIRVWLSELKELSYDVEDVVGEWRTGLLRQKIKRLNKSRINKVRSLLPSPRTWINQVAFRHDIANKIKQLNGKLDFVTRQKERFRFVTHDRVVVDRERPRTTSVIDVSEVHGRGKDKISVKNMLLSTATGQVGEVLRVVSIVGMGGIGKTTLARSVYIDDQVTTHFDLKFWVCVSDHFDETRVAKEILEKCKGERPSVDSMDIILQQICEHVSKNKILLILDDVWTHEFGKWDQLLNTLKCAALGSKILVTTRNQKVAMVLGSRQVDVFPLGILNEVDSWSLFTRLAFHDRTSEEIEELKEIGEKIVMKCEGLPLAIKIIGNHLRFTRSREEWQAVLISKTWEIKDAEKSLFGLLLLSYHELSWVAKRCFLCCALFPKDYKFLRNELLDFWIAQGFFPDIEKAEREAKEHLDALIVRCFFQDLDKFDNGNIYGFKMHDIIHDFAIFLGEGGCCIGDSKEIHSSAEKVTAKNVRHMLLNFRDEESIQFPCSINGCKKLRSLHTATNYTRFDVDLSTLDWGQLRCLRTLKLAYLQFEVLPKGICKLGLLSHLDLSCNLKLRVLPESICDLCNLQILDISWCKSLEKLPGRIGELINLKVLLNFETEKVMFLPKGVERLSKVEVMSEFVVSGRKKDASLAELGSLPNIKKIKITGLGNIRDVDEVMKARLEDKSKLSSLRLKFNRTIESIEEAENEKVLQALVPPASLKYLWVLDYSGRPNGLSNWMASLNNLKSLTLKRCGELEQLPPIGKFMPNLENLIIQGMQRVRKVGAEFLGILLENGSMKTQTFKHQVVYFPNLKCLTFRKMERWDEWEWISEEEEAINVPIIMPCLTRLNINGCPKLIALPPQLLAKPTLKLLSIQGSPIAAESSRLTKV